MAKEGQPASRKKIAFVTLPLDHHQFIQSPYELKTFLHENYSSPWPDEGINLAPIHPDCCMNVDQEPTSQKTTTCAKDRCSTGGCGGPGLCPGVALLFAYAAGGGIALLTGLNWLGWAVGILLALILITGAWRFFRGLRSET